MTINLTAKLLIIRKKPVIVYPLHKRENPRQAREIEDMILEWCKKNLARLKEQREYHMSAVWSPDKGEILKVSLYDTLDNWSVLPALTEEKPKTNTKAIFSTTKKKELYEKIQCISK